MILWHIFSPQLGYQNWAERPRREKASAECFRTCVVELTEICPCMDSESDSWR